MVTNETGTEPFVMEETKLNSGLLNDNNGIMRKTCKYTLLKVSKCDTIKLPKHLA